MYNYKYENICNIIITDAAAPGTNMAYSLSGVPATDTTRGLVIENKRKVVRK